MSPLLRTYESRKLKSKEFLILREIVLDDYDNETEDSSIKFTINNAPKENLIKSKNTNTTNAQTKNLIDDITDIFGSSSQVKNDLNIFGGIDLTATQSNTNTNQKTNDLMSTLGAVIFYFI